MTEFETLEWSVDERGVGTVVLDRPAVLNAMGERMLAELAEAFDRLDRIDRDGDLIRAVVFDGAGDQAFSAGADISGFGESRYPHVDRIWKQAMSEIADCDPPVIAKIDGYCVGGGLEMALACDFRIASERSEFGFPEIDIGLFPSGGGTQRLPPLVGPSRAKELCITGEFVDGNQAAEDGLIERVCPAPDLDTTVDEFVDTIVSKPPLAVRAVLDTIDRSLELGLSQGIAYEHAASIPLLYTDDYREGVAAFDADREPEWTGR